MHRRKFLATAGAVALSGCSSSNLVSTDTPTPSLAETGWASVSTETSVSEISASIEGDLPPQKFGIYTLNPSERIEYEIATTVESDGTMDVATMDRSEFDRYRDGEGAAVYSSLSSQDIQQATDSGVLSSGRYVIVFDNSLYGEAKPEGNLQFVSDITATRP